MAGNAIRPAELAEQAFDSVVVLLDVRIDLGVGAFEIGVGHQPGAAVARPDDVHHVQVPLADEAVPMHVEEVQSWRGAPMTQQARLHVFQRQRTIEQGVVLKVDLPDRKIIGRAPVGVHAVEFFMRQRTVGGCRGRCHFECSCFAHDVPRTGNRVTFQPNRVT